MFVASPQLMKTKRLPDGSVVYVDPQGIMQVHDFGGGVSLHVRRGIMTGDFAPYVIQDGERQIQKYGRFVLMVDGVEAKMHTTEFREAMTTWFRDHETGTVHMLIRSKMLDMALTVANLALGSARAKAYVEVDVWEAVGRREARTFKRMPLVSTADATSD
jgi:hypothetical protein